MEVGGDFTVVLVVILVQLPINEATGRLELGRHAGSEVKAAQEFKGNHQYRVSWWPLSITNTTNTSTTSKSDMNNSSTRAASRQTQPTASRYKGVITNSQQAGQHTRGKGESMLHFN